MSVTPPPLHRRLLAITVLALLFARELVMSSLRVARTALARDISVRPAIIRVPLDLRSDLGVTVVANLVSLTPGTTSLHVSDDRRFLYVHCLDAPSQEAVVRSIKLMFEHWVREAGG
jgi:multicomponent Na+:H+ antiporter subunit E